MSNFEYLIFSPKLIKYFNPRVGSIENFEVMFSQTGLPGSLFNQESKKKRVGILNKEGYNLPN